jgi:two-component system OmpR family sensor kinase
MTEHRPAPSRSEYAIAVLAPIAAAMVSWLFAQVVPLPNRGVLVLLAIALLAYRLPPRPVRLAYAVSLVAILLPLLAPGTVAGPDPAVELSWAAFAAVGGVITYLLTQLHRQAERLDQLDRLKATFVGLANHELRTPVAVLHASLDILDESARERLDPQEQTFFDAAKTSSGALAYIVETLTQFETLEQDTRRSRAPLAPLRSTVDSTVQRLREVFESHGVELTVDLDPAAATRVLPEAYARIILEQLLSNAARFNSQGGHAELHARLERENLVLQVVDDGWGIPQAARESIFESFYQAGEVLTRPKGGLGLGLALVRLAVQRLEGSIELDSAVGAGSTFTIRLPLVADGPAMAARQLRLGVAV